MDTACKTHDTDIKQIIAESLGDNLGPKPGFYRFGHGTGNGCLSYTNPCLRNRVRPKGSLRLFVGSRSCVAAIPTVATVETGEFFGEGEGGGSSYWYNLHFSLLVGRSGGTALQARRPLNGTLDGVGNSQ